MGPVLTRPLGMAPAFPSKAQIFHSAHGADTLQPGASQQTRSLQGEVGETAGGGLPGTIPLTQQEGHRGGDPGPLVGLPMNAQGEMRV